MAKFPCYEADFNTPVDEFLDSLALVPNFFPNLDGGDNGAFQLPLGVGFTEFQ